MGHASVQAISRVVLPRAVRIHSQVNSSGIYDRKSGIGARQFSFKKMLHFSHLNPDRVQWVLHGLSVQGFGHTSRFEVRKHNLTRFLYKRRLSLSPPVLLLLFLLLFLLLLLGAKGIRETLRFTSVS
jgi:hypothetical protein